MDNLLVAGCSVSDYTYVNEVWGESLAEQLNLNYIHQAAGCGSNWRIWRKIFESVNLNIITPHDTIIIQYTSTERREFWSPFEISATVTEDKGPLSEEYDSGCIIRYKIDAEQWVNHPQERKLFKQYSRFINEKFELEQFHMMHSMFQSYMKDKGFKKIYFLKAGKYGPLKGEQDLIDYYKNNWIAAPNAFKYHLPNDPSHLNQKGHNELASLVHKYIN